MALEKTARAAILAALASAALFGAAAPLAKLLVGPLGPWMLAGILYLGSGFGLALVRMVRRSPSAPISPRDLPWLSAAILLGGIVAPVLLMWGLANADASSASLLLNAEGVLTALIAWFAFKENFDRRIALGIVFIAAGAVVLSWPSDGELQATLPLLAILAACLCWALDNNFTRKVALADAATIAMWKGLVAGGVNVAIAMANRVALPEFGTVAAASVLGFFSYGVSLVLFVRALRGLGTARTGAYFSTAPFAGAALSIVLLNEPITWPLAIASVLMAVGVWLHVSERHSHYHEHEPLEHDHGHEHDLHHQHEHVGLVPEGIRHSHPHHHDAMAHSHEHFPDAHHRHDHR